MSAPLDIPKLEASPAIIESKVDSQTPPKNQQGNLGFSAMEADRKAPALPPTSAGPAPLPSPPNETRLSPQGSPRAIPINSPSRMYRSSSPRLHSPASSLIFERNVQESTLPGELSPAIPAHIQTEDRIPPVLEASSLAITDDHLNPDEVEIVMHAAHQPAAAAVTGESNMAESLISSLALQDDASQHIATPSAPQNPSPPQPDESASTYGSLDSTDVRRLSFISFADVVQSEHVEQSGGHLHTHSSILSSPAAGRSPSPIRSQTSSHGVSGSPPASGSPAMHAFDQLAASRFSGSPLIKGAQSPPSTMASGGELTIETMSEAMRKTGSEELGAGAVSGTASEARSPTQPMSIDENKAL